MKVTEIAFIDTETTGLNPHTHELWEIGVILATHSSDIGVVNEVENTFHVEPLHLHRADPTGLRINRYYERAAKVNWGDKATVARWLAQNLDGRHVIGAVPDFDTRFLDNFLRTWGQCPTWHYHLIDVENLAAGWIAAHGEHTDGHEVGMPPYSSEELSHALGVDPAKFERHTALGDARWAMAVYRAVYG